MQQPEIKSPRVMFNITTSNGSHELLDGQVVVMPGFEKFTFYVHTAFLNVLDEDGAVTYEVTEGSTGQMIGKSQSETKELAVEVAYQKLIKAGIDTVEQKIKSTPKIKP